MTGRRAIAVLVVLAALGVGTTAAVLVFRVSPCGAERVSGGSPLLSVAGMTEQPDPRLARLTRAVDSWGAPFGPVRAGAGFDYGQWLHLYGVANGMLAFTKNNADITLLGNASTPRWTLRPLHRRVAWDASADRFLLLGLTAGKATVVSSYDLAGGTQSWCVHLPDGQADGQPVATTFLDGGGDVLVALPEGRRIRLARLASGNGHTLWSRSVAGVARADFLGQIAPGTVLMGGTEEYRLAQPDPSAPAGPVLSAFGTGDGKPAWSWSVPAGTLAHVVGATASVVVVHTRSAAAGGRLVGLSPTGQVLWQRTVPADADESALRSGVVLTRTRARLDAYDAATGRALWHRPVPTERTYFPYGFSLDQMPSLDAGHLLMPTTMSLEALDVRTGRTRSYPLPTDGINTTYWPYQLAVTDHLLGVVTNIGGVVAGREPLNR